MKPPKCLIDYKANCARAKFLDYEIPRLQKLAKQLEKDVSWYSGVVYGEENRHAEGSHSDPTGREAVRDIPEDVRQLYEDICALIIEQNRTALWIALAEQVLAFLPEKQRIIVELRAVEGLTWADVGDEIFERTGRDYTERALRYQYKSAMEKINPFFFAAPVISND